MINIFEDGEMKPINSYAFQPGTFVAPLAENANHANTANIAAKGTDGSPLTTSTKTIYYSKIISLPNPGSVKVFSSSHFFKDGDDNGTYLIVIKAGLPGREGVDITARMNNIDLGVFMNVAYAPQSGGVFVTLPITYVKNQNGDIPFEVTFYAYAGRGSSNLGSIEIWATKISNDTTIEKRTE